jgi:hypothetical protein
VGTLTVTGAIIAGPDRPTTDFPTGETNVALVAKVQDYAVAMPHALVAIASPSAYVDVPSIGSAVTTVSFLYLRAETSLLFRFTTTDGTSVLRIDGLAVLEFAASAPLTRLEVQGRGRYEILAAGPA